MISSLNSIGRVNFVSFDKISFEISDFESLEYNSNGYFYFAQGVLDFITILNNQNDKFIYQVDRIEDKELLLSKDENGKFSYIANVWATPIGVIKNNKINFNLKKYPFLRNPVFLTESDDFESIFQVSPAQSIPVGMFNQNYSIRFNLNNLLTYHTAILGNTGSGKSTTIRQIVSEIKKIQTDNLCLHIFDVHNEYEKLVDRSIDVLNEFQIEVKSLDLEDWINLLEPSDLVQLPILRRALQLGNAIDNEQINSEWLELHIAYSLYNNVQTDAVAKRAKIIGLLRGKKINLSHYTVFGSFNDPSWEYQFKLEITNKMIDLESKMTDPLEFIQKKIESSGYCIESFNTLVNSLNYVFLLEESKGNNQIRNFATTLQTRIEDVQSHYKNLFTESPLTRRNEKITVYDVSQLDDDLLMFFASYVSKMIFIQNSQLTFDQRNINVLILEEAHRYISREKEKLQPYGVNIFKKIAREGRKFGVFLSVSSQRPSELSGTILSQCNNFLLHRIKNNVDLEYMSKTIPYITQNQLKRLSFLPTGTTYAVGELFSIPIEVDVFDNEMTMSPTKTPSVKFIKKK
ncbi:MAG: ATP-binding protein [Leuconostoc suionicum]|uniref:ATP-binding protein n=1 Tax=Leuconostoc suionicum TaxID=1511761 RepID=UPI0039EA2CF8